jgi:hypothetical protein
MFSFESIDSIINTAGKYYRILPTILSILYVLVFIGLVYINPEYLQIFRTIMQLFVCLFLIYRFHPYRNHVLGKYDAQIIFSSAIFLLVNVTAVDIANKLINPLDNAINIAAVPIADIVKITDVPLSNILEVM